MSRLRIKSNPYIKCIEYAEYIDDKYNPITFANKPNSKLVGSGYSNVIFSENTEKIMNEIFESFYSSKDDIYIEFNGTDIEYETLKMTIKNDKYESKFKVDRGDAVLKAEQEVYSALKDVVNKIKLTVDEDETKSIYVRINKLWDSLNNYQKEIEKKEKEANNEYAKLNNEKGEGIDLLKDTISEQEKKRKEYMDSYSVNLDKLIASILGKYVLSKEELKQIYDDINNDVKDKIRDGKSDAADESIITEEENSPLKFGKKAIKKVINFVSPAIDYLGNEVKRISKTDKIFLDKINQNYQKSVIDVKNDIKEMLYNELCDRERTMKNIIENSVNKIENLENNDEIRKNILSLKKSEKDIFNKADIKQTKKELVALFVHIPGQPVRWAIRNEWKSELKSLINNTYKEFSTKSTDEYDRWFGEVLDDIQENIEKFNPNKADISKKVIKFYNERKKYEKILEKIKLNKLEIESMLIFME